MSDEAIRMIVSDLIRNEYEDEAVDGVIPNSKLFGLTASIINVVRINDALAKAPAPAGGQAGTGERRS
jgi:hypothetical protein